MRIVSLLPSATETLLAITGPAALGPGSPVRLVGRSHECDFPPGVLGAGIPVLTRARTAFASSAQVDAEVRSQLATGTSLYELDEALLEALKPDLIITQDLCRVCSIDLNAVRQVASRLSRPPEILSLNPHTFEAVLDDVLRVGEAIGMERAATDVLVGLRGRAHAAEDYVGSFAPRVGVAFIEWTDPIFVGGHWTPQLIERAGGEHPLNPTRPIASAGAAEGPVGQSQRTAGPSITVTPEALADSQPQVIVISPCGLSLADAEHEAAILARKPWFGLLPAARAGQVWVVDGNQMFSRPGPRLVDALEFLVGVLAQRPEVIPANFPARRLSL